MKLALRPYSEQTSWEHQKHSKAWWWQFHAVGMFSSSRNVKLVRDQCFAYITYLGKAFMSWRGGGVLRLWWPRHVCCALFVPKLSFLASASVLCTTSFALHQWRQLSMGVLFSRRGSQFCWQGVAPWLYNGRGNAGVEGRITEERYWEN